MITEKFNGKIIVEKTMEVLAEDVGIIIELEPPTRLKMGNAGGKIDPPLSFEILHRIFDVDEHLLIVLDNGLHGRATIINDSAFMGYLTPKDD